MLNLNILALGNIQSTKKCGYFCLGATLEQPHFFRCGAFAMISQKNAVVVVKTERLKNMMQHAVQLRYFVSKKQQNTTRS